MIEYAFNAIIFVFTDIFAFMINYDFESRMSFDFIESFESKSVRERILRIKEVNMTKKMKKVFEFTKKKLVKSQNNQKTNYKEDDLV
jgi:hypothetical protein